MTDARRSRARATTTSADADSVRRIGEALLMAQNRARVSAERANRSERMLRTVLSQINLQSGVLLHELEEYPRTMSFDSLADWSLLRSLIETPEDARLSGPSEQTSFALTMAHAHATPHTLSSVSRDSATDDIRAVARDVVMNLHVAARTADRRIQKLATLQDPPATSVRLPLQTWLARVLGLEAYYYARPWQFMAGVMLGFALGIVTTRRWILERAIQPADTVSPTKHPSAMLMDQPALAASGTTPASVSGMTCRGDALTKRQMTKLHLAASRLPVTFAMEDMSYLLHPSTEVS